MLQAPPSFKAALSQTLGSFNSPVLQEVFLLLKKFHSAGFQAPLSFESAVLQAQQSFNSAALQAPWSFNL